VKALNTVADKTNSVGYTQGAMIAIQNVTNVRTIT